MKFAFILISFFSSMALATGEYTTVTCSGQTEKGADVRVNFCLSGESSSQDETMYDVVPCGENEEFEYITINRYKNVSKMTPDMVETAQIPGRLANVYWLEDGLTVQLQDANAGLVYIEAVAGEAAVIKIDLPNGLKNSFTNGKCEFNASNFPQ